MTFLELTPVNLTGAVHVPSSKSMGHRELICAALAGQLDDVTALTPSEDIAATERVLRQLRKETAEQEPLNCGESGSTLRFLIPVALALKSTPLTFTGQGKLISRPLRPYYEIFSRQGIAFHHEHGGLPLTVEGPLRAGLFELPGDVSSQFVSGLLFALPLLQGTSEIVVTTPLESVSYVRLTLEALSAYGIVIEHTEDYRHYYVRGGQCYVRQRKIVEGDYSQAAFWLVAGTLGAPVDCFGINAQSLQGDRVITAIINAMGGKVSWQDDRLCARPALTHGIIIDAADCPDLVPILSVLAALSQGRTCIIHAERLRLKECDRLRAMSVELRKLGAIIEETPDGLSIEGRARLNGGRVKCWNDHRVAMSLAVAAIKCKSAVHIDGVECVAKSYPNFWEDYRLLGGVCR